MFNASRLSMSTDDMEGYRSLFERRRLLNSAVSLTALGAQFVMSLLMASSQQDKASWNDEETQALVDHLWENRGNDGDGSFKEAVWNGAPAHIAHLLTSGPIKTVKQCKTKYINVSTNLYNIVISSLKTDIIHSSKASIETSSHIGILHQGLIGIMRKVQTLRVMQRC